ncbi:hypothetical protein ALQ20_200165 [Pseudomonas syringae pv. atrofaciens]|nr:hypothetical protein [Pseudomonas sp. PvP028]RMP58175.1 hypothetical protein ALQ20_200165 [Pseudomonas syringae pv. atrofaciens]
MPAVVLSLVRDGSIHTVDEITAAIVRVVIAL